MSAAPSPHPCASCPYRRDVPSGVWDAVEYEKLPGYDGETWEQPPTAFLCHQGNGRLCSGWVGCHDMQNSFGLRLALSMGVIDGEAFDAALAYESPVPLFESGAAAAAHGLRDVAQPGAKARRTMGKLEARRERKATGC